MYGICIHGNALAIRRHEEGRSLFALLHGQLLDVELKLLTLQDVTVSAADLSRAG